jgi:hypothetical protein
MKTLDDETSDRVSFIAFIIGEFADTYRMNRQQAYLYLKQYGGLEFLCECWWALHTDNPVHAVFDINKICERNGGTQ